MAYLIESHFNANCNCTVPAYCQPDNAPSTYPCDTQEEAEQAEQDKDWEE